MKKTSRVDVVRAIALEADSGIPVGPLCRRHGISVPTFYRWIKRLNIKLSEGRKIIKKKRNPHVVTLRVQKTLDRIVKRNPNLSAKRLSTFLRREGCSISERSINLFFSKYSLEDAIERKLNALVKVFGEKKRKKILEFLSPKIDSDEQKSDSDEQKSDSDEQKSDSDEQKKIIPVDPDIQGYSDLLDIREKMATAKEREIDHLGLPFFLSKIDQLILLQYPKRIAMVLTIQTLLRYRPFPGEGILPKSKNTVHLTWKYLIKSWLKRAKDEGIREIDISKVMKLASLTPEEVLVLSNKLKSFKSYRVRNANGGWNLQSFPPSSKTKGM